MAISNTSTITVDGNFTDWTASELITTPVNAVSGYSLYGTVQNNTYFIGIDATSLTDPAIGAGTTIWLNTDQNTTTGYSPFGSIGAEYNITYIPNATGGGGAFYLYTGAAAQTLVSGPLTAALSADGKSLEIAIPRSLITSTSGTAPTNINVAGWIDTATPASEVFLPGDYTNPEYTITDPATLVARTPTHKVAIVYSDTTAALYFRGLGDAAGAPSTAYSDLFMAAQNQARMAGVSYDVIDESQLTNINNLIGYDAIIFPAMADVNTAQLPAIMSTLTSAVYNYHISIITSGDFLTNDQTGAALPNPYANMETLLGLTRASGGNSGTVTVTANDVSNPIMSSYTAGQTIQTFSNEGYTAYTGVGGVTPEYWSTRTLPVSVRSPVLSRPRPAAPTSNSPARICSATTTCCRTSSRASCSARSQVSCFICLATRASWPCAWTWTNRSSPQMCLLRVAPASTIS